MYQSKRKKKKKKRQRQDKRIISHTFTPLRASFFLNCRSIHHNDIFVIIWMKMRVISFKLPEMWLLKVQAIAYYIHFAIYFCKYFIIPLYCSSNAKHYDNAQFKLQKQQRLIHEEVESIPIMIYKLGQTLKINKFMVITMHIKLQKQQRFIHKEFENTPIMIYKLGKSLKINKFMVIYILLWTINKIGHYLKKVFLLRQSRSQQNCVEIEKRMNLLWLGTIKLKLQL